VHHTSILAVFLIPKKLDVTPIYSLLL